MTQTTQCACKGVPASLPDAIPRSHGRRTSLLHTATNLSRVWPERRPWRFTSQLGITSQARVLAGPPTSEGPWLVPRSCLTRRLPVSSGCERRP